jgi:hypothetical protein
VNQVSVSIRSVLTEELKSPITMLKLLEYMTEGIRLTKLN